MATDVSVGPSAEADPAATHRVPDASASSGGGRDPVIDMIRGLCMVSMITGHVAPYSVIGQVLHIPRFITGLDGFIFLSGYVLGLIDPRRVARYGEAGTARRMLARAGILYVVQAFFIALVLLWYGNGGFWPLMPDIAERGGWGPYLLSVAVFREGIPRNRLLSLYVVFLALAPAVLWLIRRGWTVPVMCVCVALYTAHWLSGANWYPLDHEMGFKVAGWQLLFFAGVAVGYHNDYLRSRVWTRMRVPALVGSVALVLFFLASAFVVGRHSPQWHADPQGLFDTLGLGPLRIPYFAAAVVLLYWTFGRLHRRGWLARLLGILQTFGSRSLYCFTTHMVFLLIAVAFRFKDNLIPLQMGPSVTALLLEAWAWGVLVIVYLMARYRVLAKVIPN